jgi:hypothetical protein
MIEFWGWFYKKYEFEFNLLTACYGKVDFDGIPHGLIIGRMIEYLIQHKKNPNFFEFYSIEKPHETELFYSIEELYDYLVKEIEALS